MTANEFVNQLFDSVYWAIIDRYPGYKIHEVKKGAKAAFVNLIKKLTELERNDSEE